jgi:predicted transcriptional regulator
VGAEIITQRLITYRRGSMTQNAKVYEVLVNVRPFSMTSQAIYDQLKGAVPKVSVNRCLNELMEKGLVAKLDKVAQGSHGRSNKLWRATYR